jgi:hypothetical protein
MPTTREVMLPHTNANVVAPTAVERIAMLRSSRECADMSPYPTCENSVSLTRGPRWTSGVRMCALTVVIVQMVQYMDAT